MNTYDLIKIERKTKLTYPKDKVFDDIKSICKAGIGKYSVMDENSTFGSIKISVISGLNAIVMDINVSDSDNTTDFSLSAYNATGSKATQASIGGIADDFLKLLDMKLKGEKVDADMVEKTAGGSGCIWIILLAIAAAIIFFLI